MEISEELDLLENGLKSIITFIDVCPEIIEEVKEEIKSDKEEDIEEFICEGFAYELYEIRDRNYCFECHLLDDESFMLFITKKITRIPLLISDKSYAKFFGKLLGYPKCCIKQYIRDLRKVRKDSSISDGAIQKYINQTKNFDPYMFEFHFSDKALSKFEGYESPFICHIPCHPKCKATRALFYKYREVLNENEN